jgi:hypothetical protein
MLVLYGKMGLLALLGADAWKGMDGNKTKERVILLHACVIIDSIDV